LIIINDVNCCAAGHELGSNVFQELRLGAEALYRAKTKNSIRDLYVPYAVSSKSSRAMASAIFYEFWQTFRLHLFHEIGAVDFYGSLAKTKLVRHDLVELALSKPANTSFSLLLKVANLF